MSGMFTNPKGIHVGMFTNPNTKGIHVGDVHCFAAPLSQGPEHKALTEVKSALTNLQASITSLSSEQHKTGE